MALTIEDIKNALSAEEPDYKALAEEFGSEAIPHLEKLAKMDDPLMASKAVYLSSAISDRRSVDILKDAAEDPKPEVRIAAASGASNLISTADRRGLLADVNMTGVEEVLDMLKNDSDVGVSKVARKSLGSMGDVISKDKENK
jgi:HEAT repeat protein